MRPQTRHFTERSLIFNHFEALFSSFDDFVKKNCIATWKSMDAELFSRKWYLPGALFLDAPYQLKDAIELGKFVFGPLRSLGTLSAVLYHQNYSE